VVNSQPALSQVLVKTEADGKKTFYVYGLGLIGEETGSKYTSYHFDLRGSTIALTNSTGQVTERFQYSPYGVLLSGDMTKTPFLFNGLYGVMTDSNGLYYMRARFYSPEMRRFVNQDILLGGIGDGQSLNRYAYVTGRPVSFVDPFGLSRCALMDFYSNPDGFLACLFEETFGWIFYSEVPRPYFGGGGYLDYHLLFRGQNTEEVFVTDLMQMCLFKTDCGSVGLGLFSGCGVTFPIGISMSDIESSLSDNSIGLAVDFGSCLTFIPAYGAGISMGYNDEGITSFGSSKGAARFGGGCGFSMTVDICLTEVQWCRPKKDK
jgi:RHS repeat-associated protein